MENKLDRIPVIDPLILALKSRRVLVAIVALIVGLLVNTIPELAVVQTEITVLLATLALAVIAGYSVEDAAAAGRTASSEVTIDLEESARELISAVVDEAFAKRGEPVMATLDTTDFDSVRIPPKLHAMALGDDVLFQEVRRRQVGSRWGKAVRDAGLSSDNDMSDDDDSDDLQF